MARRAVLRIRKYGCIGPDDGSADRPSDRFGTNMSDSKPTLGTRHTRPPETLPAPGRRVHVVGTSCTGKTTMATALADAFGVPHVELDALHWGPRWTPTPHDELRSLVAEAISGEAWTIDGNYGRLRDVIWPRADTVVWLDYSLPLVLWRMLKRTSRRIGGRQVLWSGNRESVRSFLFSRDSLLLWALQTHRQHQRLYPALLSRQENTHLTFVRIRSSRLADAWLGAVRSDSSP
jgi:adenylate kinase family enzyme